MHWSPTKSARAGRQTIEPMPPRAGDTAARGECRSNCRRARKFRAVPSDQRANLRCHFVRCGARRRVPSRPLRLRPVSGARFARTSATATWAERTQPGCGSKTCPQTPLPKRATRAGARRRVERMTLRLRPVAALGCILRHRGTPPYAASRRANMASTGLLRKIVLLGECGRLRPSACRPPRAFPCSRDVRRHRGGCRCDPCRLPAARRVLGCPRAAPAVPGHRRQRAGSRMRAHHRRLEAVATAAEADAETAAVMVSALLRVGWTTSRGESRLRPSQSPRCDGRDSTATRTERRPLGVMVSRRVGK
jgi:hypothetical protein